MCKKGIKSNNSRKLEAENRLEATKTKTDDDVNMIPSNEPSNVDAPPKGTFVYILVVENQT